MSPILPNVPTLIGLHAPPKPGIGIAPRASLPYPITVSPTLLAIPVLDIAIFMSIHIRPIQKILRKSRGIRFAKDDHTFVSGSDL